MAPHAYRSAHFPSAAEGFRTHIQAEEEEEEEEEGAEILFLMFLTDIISVPGVCFDSGYIFLRLFWWHLVRPIAPGSHLFGVGCCSGVQGLWFSGR